MGLEQFIEDAQPLPLLAELVLHLVPREASLGGRGASLSLGGAAEESRGVGGGGGGWGAQMVLRPVVVGKVQVRSWASGWTPQPLPYGSISLMMAGSS